MGAKTISISQARGRLPQLIKELSEDDSPCYITHHGKAQAIIIDIKQYDKMMELIENKVRHRRGGKK